ncbi:MAG: hypothetical protein ACM31C_03890 [Acidobacteriota bacterium]
MKKISIAFLAALSLMSIAGCKKKGDDMMGKMTEFKEKMCACKAGDKDCAMKVQKEMQEYAEGHKGEQGKMSDEDMKKATDIGMEMAKCSSKAMGMGGDMMGGTPPAGGSAAAPAGGSAEAPAGGSAEAPAGGSAAAPAGGSAAAPAAPEKK